MNISWGKTTATRTAKLRLPTYSSLSILFTWCKISCSKLIPLILIFRSMQWLLFSIRGGYDFISCHMACVNYKTSTIMEWYQIHALMLLVCSGFGWWYTRRFWKIITTQIAIFSFHREKIVIVNNKACNCCCGVQTFFSFPGTTSSCLIVPITHYYSFLTIDRLFCCLFCFQGVKISKLEV